MLQPAKRRSVGKDPTMVASPDALRSDFADDPEMTELVDMFVRELPERLEALEAAWRGGDALSLRRMAHQLKGAGSGYGFPVVSEAAGLVEAALVECGRAPEMGLAEVGTRVEALAALCRRAMRGGSGGR